MGGRESGERETWERKRKEVTVQENFFSWKERGKNLLQGFASYVIPVVTVLFSYRMLKPFYILYLLSVHT